MLHELLLALSGNTGGVFREKDFGRLQVATDLPFIHGSEVDLLNRICKLGSYYQKLQTFVKTYSEVSPVVIVNSCEDITKQEPCGLFIQAFSTGLDHVLASYRKCLVDLEKQILEDPTHTLTYVQQSLEKYQEVFPALLAVIERIQTNKIFGCQLLDILFQSCKAAVTSVKDALERILYVCHGALYKQLSAWLFYGLLIDTHGEFFIQEVKSAHEPVINNTDEIDTIGRNDLGIPGITGKQLKEIQETLEGEDKPQMPSQWQFKINPEMLPSYIPTRVADKVLFIGESVRMSKGFQLARKSKSQGSVVHEKEEEFTRSFFALQQQPTFDLKTFEKEIDELRLCVAKHLWKLVVEDANLMKHLQILKEFFLLGRGELFSAFIEHAAGLLRIPPSENTEYDTNAAFEQVIRKFLPDDDETTSLFTVGIDKDIAQQEKKEKMIPDHASAVITGWDCFKFHCHVRWPLHILFQPVVLEKYNTLCRFLLKVKRTQLDLQRVWAVYMGTKHISTVQLSSMTKIWLSRMRMAFLVDNLQYYLQVDVLEARYVELVDKINSTRDFESIRLAHDHFISTLMAQSFLLMKPVSHCLDEVLNLCQSFSMVLLQSGAPNLLQRENTQIDHIIKMYERQSVMLFQILSSVRSHQGSPHLAQLLLRIDFNKQFSTFSQSAFSLTKKHAGV